MVRQAEELPEGAEGRCRAQVCREHCSLCSDMFCKSSFPNTFVLGGKSSPRLPVNIITQSVHVAIELIQLHLSCAFNKTLTGTLAFGNYCTTSPQNAHAAPSPIPRSGRLHVLKEPGGALGGGLGSAVPSQGACEHSRVHKAPFPVCG